MTLFGFSLVVFRRDRVYSLGLRVLRWGQFLSPVLYRASPRSFSLPRLLDQHAPAPHPWNGHGTAAPTTTTTIAGFISTSFSLVCTAVARRRIPIFSAGSGCRRTLVASHWRVLARCGQRCLSPRSAWSCGPARVCRVLDGETSTRRARHLVRPMLFYYVLLPLLTLILVVVLVF